MARKKLSEYRAKHIVAKAIGTSYEGWEASVGNVPPRLPSKQHYVVKVDQAVKRRFKKGLIALDVVANDVPATMKLLADMGYVHFLIEPFRTYKGKEHYIAFKRDRSGIIISYSKLGGVEIEAHADAIQSGLFDELAIAKLSKETGFSVEQLLSLRATFDALHMTLLEINPYVVEAGKILILDAAIEVDSAAELLVSEWSDSDTRSSAKNPTDEEVAVHQLAKESPASFSLEVINPDGAIFLLLSGGGASVVIADEIYALGYGEQLANYGEYSGNPSEDETYRYTAQVIKLLLRSKAPKKVAFIGGAVANFTDIANTFKGIVAVLNENADALTKQKVKFYVRRGGPRQEEGLRMIESVLKDLGILGGVYAPSVSIPQAVESLLGGLK